MMQVSELLKYLETLEEAISSHLPIGEPGTPIVLYEGQLECTQNDQTFSADGRVIFKWTPKPLLRFHIPEVPANTKISGGGLSIRLDDGTKIDHGSVTRRNFSTREGVYKESISGIFHSWVLRREDLPVRYVLFLLPNFLNLCGKFIKYPDGSNKPARLTLCAEGWRIILDGVQNRNEVEDFLKDKSGFAVTHVGRLEKIDQSEFSAQDCFKILNALSWYISFAAGNWTGPCLPAGFNADGQKQWQAWTYSRMAPFQNNDSWLDPTYNAQFEGLFSFEAPFPGFLKLKLDEDWEEVIRLAIHWYVEANTQAGSIQGSIVLTQTAFELLASVVLVENLKLLSANQYENLANAANRTRELFRLWAKIPLEIPSQLKELTELAESEKWDVPDTAMAMTKIRNNITHSEKKNRDKARKYQVANADVWKLGLWNLELCLLRLFEYQGMYSNRLLPHRFAGDVELVPWVAKPTS